MTVLVVLVELMELGGWEIGDCAGSVLDAAWLTAEAATGEDVEVAIQIEIDDVADTGFPYPSLTTDVGTVGAPPAATQIVVVMSIVSMTSCVATTVTRSRLKNGTAAAKLRRPETAKRLDCFIFSNECQKCCYARPEGNCESEGNECDISIGLQ